DYPAEIEPSVRAVVVNYATRDGIGAVLAIDVLIERDRVVLQRDRDEQPLHRRARLEGVLYCGVMQALADARAVGGDICERQHLAAEWIEHHGGAAPRTAGTDFGSQVVFGQRLDP